MKKLLLAGAGLVVVWMAVRQFTGSSFKLTNSREKNVEILQRLAAELNRGLPKQLDEHTLMLRVEANNLGIVNHYKTLKLTDFDMRVGGVLDQLKPALLKQTCANRAYKMAMSKGFSIGYSYVDRNDVSVGTLTYRPGHCIGL